MISTGTFLDMLNLRQRVLRPYTKAEECVYEGDKDKLSGHFYYILNETKIGIASIYNQAQENKSDNGAWRIRGMAILPEFQGKGFGLELLDACISHAKKNDGRFIWCNGRENALSFYKKRNFFVDGDSFELPNIGTHFVLRKIL